MDCAEAKPLLAGKIDDELTPSEADRLHDHLSHCSNCRDDLLELKELKGLTSGLGGIDQLDPFWDRYWLGIYNRMERGLGFILLSLGATLLLGFGAWHFVRDFLSNESIPGIVRLGVGTSAMGGIILVISVLRQHWLGFRHDPYKEIKR